MTKKEIRDWVYEMDKVTWSQEGFVYFHWTKPFTNTTGQMYVDVNQMAKGMHKNRIYPKSQVKQIFSLIKGAGEAELLDEFDMDSIKKTIICSGNKLAVDAWDKA